MISEKAATALATIGTVCWCVQLIPQIIFNYRRKDCEGLPPLMMLMWVASGIPFAIYFMVIKGNIILQIQPHLFMLFCGVSYVQSLYYPPVQWERRKIVATLLTLIAVDVGMEIGFTLWLRPVYAHGTKWPALIFGIIASVLLALGLIPPYLELAKRKGRVVGINFVFLAIDSAGAWLSIASVIVGNMDILSIVLYGIVAGLELGIFASHFIWCCRFKWFGREAVPTDPENQPQTLEKTKSSGEESVHETYELEDER
ncbi:LAFA_0E06502g1_1 [Lachancea sp. 'fantastica']|nr:LAFA_0E06502g1_1 [Lachancea sp. 'fantastica']